MLMLLSSCLLFFIHPQVKGQPCDQGSSSATNPDWCSKITNPSLKQTRCCNDEFRFNNFYCNDLLEPAEPFGWMKPFTGLELDGSLMHRYHWLVVCSKIPADGNLGFWRTSPSYRFLNTCDQPEICGKMEYNTNRLRFEDNVIAQEGMSFCVIGAHMRKSSWSLWGPLRSFRPLLEKSLDIGNHIDPEDSTRMNSFKLPNEDKLREIRINKQGQLAQNTATNIWHKDNPSLPSHRFKNVFLGLLIPQSGAGRDEAYKNNHEPVPIQWGFTKRPAHPDYQPDESCQNPYVVQVYMIEADAGIPLHNNLHIVVKSIAVSQSSNTDMKCPTGKIKFLMLEVRDQHGYPVGQFTDDVICDLDKATRDTIGDGNKCPDSAHPCKEYFGTKKNHIPCMFSHPKSSVHPSIFMLAVGKDSGSSSSSGGAPLQGDVCRNNQKPPSKVVYPKENKDEYVTEVHTTWRYAQMDHAWVSELHFATMIVEDETPIQYYTSRMSVWVGPWQSTPTFDCHCWSQHATNNLCTASDQCCFDYCSYNSPPGRAGRMVLGLINSCVNETYNTNRPYGYSAKYKVLKPTKKTKGGWDHFRSEYIEPASVNCHKNIDYGENEYYMNFNTSNPEQWGKLPIRKTLSDYLKKKYTLNSSEFVAPVADRVYRPKKFDGFQRYGFKEYPNTYELPDWHMNGMSKTTAGTDRWFAYFGKDPLTPTLKMFDSAHQDPAVLKTEFDDRPFREYFGSRYGISYKDLKHADVEALKGPDDKDQVESLEEQAKRTRCPCPYVPTTEAAEVATKTPVELEGRRLHVVNMMLAWIILVPIAFFVARFYKETYSRVFFLQEFWWYTIHYLCLVTALILSLGGIYALYSKRQQLEEPYVIVWTPATQVHIYMGYTVLGFYSVHLLLGAFRLYDLELRIIQICLHWLFGWLEYYFAAAVILAAIAIPSGIMNCITFGIYCGFLGFQLAFTLGMEYHMRRVDAELQLDPPRAYLPPPVMRVFHRDAPHSKFRIYMLAAFSLGCVLFYAAMHVSMKLEGAEISCFGPAAETEGDTTTPRPSQATG